MQLCILWSITQTQWNVSFWFCRVVQPLSRIRLFCSSWTVAHRAPLSSEFSRQEYQSGLPLPPQGIFWAEGPHLLHWQADSLLLSHQGSRVIFLILIQLNFYFRCLLPCRSGSFIVLVCLTTPNGSFIELVSCCGNRGGCSASLVTHGKESPCNAGDLGLIPGLGRSLVEGDGNPSQYPCLENFMDRGSWRIVVHGVHRSWIWLTNTFTW